MKCKCCGQEIVKQELFIESFNVARHSEWILVDDIDAYTLIEFENYLNQRGYYWTKSNNTANSYIYYTEYFSCLTPTIYRVRK